MPKQNEDKKILITKHEGKMAGIRSISTSVQLNEYCKQNAAITGSICQHCYANTLCQMRPGLAKALVHNTKELCTQMTDVEKDVPDLSGEELFRFESFGDLNNITQLHNYMQIVWAYPKVRFALYSKRYSLISDYFKDHPMPNNLNIILSSLMVNQPLDWTKIIDPTRVRPGQVKVFTVYNKEYISKHPEVKINCGSKSCYKCRLCYNPTSVISVNEILKSDQSAAESIINWRDPSYVGQMYARAGDIIKERRL